MAFSVEDTVGATRAFLGIFLLLGAVALAGDEVESQADMASDDERWTP